MAPASSSPAARNLGAWASASAPIFHPMYAQCLVRAATRIEAKTRELLSRAEKLATLHVNQHGGSNDG